MADGIVGYGAVGVVQVNVFFVCRWGHTPHPRKSSHSVKSHFSIVFGTGVFIQSCCSADFDISCVWGLFL